MFPNVSKCNSTFPRRKSLFRVSTLGKLELHSETLSKLHHEPSSKILKVTVMRNDVLFLNIHEGVQASQKYGKTDEYKSRKQQYASANRGQTKTENLTSKSLENDITAVLTGSKNTENLTSTSVENDRTTARDREQMLTKGIIEFTKIYLEEIFAKIPCRKQLPFATPMCLPLVSCDFVVSLRLHCSWGLLRA